MYCCFVLFFQWCVLWCEVCCDNGEPSKTIKILLGSDGGIVVIVIPAFCVHIVNHADGQQIQVPDGQAELYAAEQEQRCGHLAVS